jgi:triosephosphate isomerase
MTARKSIVAGNWKMNGSRAMAREYVEELCRQSWDHRVTVVLFPPTAYLSTLNGLLEASPLAQTVALGAQDLHAEASGAFTGETSAPMIRDVGGSWVIVGHSERRQYQGESDAQIAEKAVAAQRSGLTAVLCVGETEAERDAGRAEAVVRRQLGAVAEKLDAAARSELVVAYEPVWAIGTGRTASPEAVQAMHAVIRSELGALGAQAEQVPLLYGGSVKSGNAATLFQQPDIDGALVGGASLEAKEFARIVAARAAVDAEARG